MDTCICKTKCYIYKLGDVKPVIRHSCEGGDPGNPTIFQSRDRFDTSHVRGDSLSTAVRRSDTQTMRSLAFAPFERMTRPEVAEKATRFLLCSVTQALTQTRKSYNACSAMRCSMRCLKTLERAVKGSTSPASQQGTSPVAREYD
jgi:hypothetical protein